MSTSYANEGGTGERRRSIIVTVTGLSFAGAPSKLVDGANASFTVFWSGTVNSSATVKFDFGDSSYVIDEAKFYQSNSNSHGTWQWQGSNDGSSWSNIGSSFTLGGTTTQTLSALNGNTTDYHQYRLLGVSGSASGSPNLAQFEFKISPIVSRTNGLLTTSYLNTGGAGDRTGGAVVITADAGGTITTPSLTIDGNLASTGYIGNPQLTSSWVRYDFGSQHYVDEATWYGDAAGTTVGGSWKWQGSNDGSAWTDLTSPEAIRTDVGSGGSSPSQVQIFRSLNTNTTAYRYLRLFCTTGANTGNCYCEEINFRLAAATVATVVPQIMHHRRMQCT